MYIFLRKIKLGFIYIVVYLKWFFSSNRRNNYCVDKNNKDNVIISLTSFPDRLDSLYETLLTLLSQTYKPNAIELWLAQSQFKDKIVPAKISKLKKYGLEIKWCKDIKSYKKLIPGLIEHPDSIIITVDDDAVYKKDMVEKLMKSYYQNQNDVHCHLVYKYAALNNTLIKLKGQTEKLAYANRIVGIGGVLYPPNSLYKDVINEELFTSLCPNNDDIWFWFMAILNERKVCFVDGHNDIINACLASIETPALWEQNAQQDLTNKCLEKLCKYYPKALQLIKDEQNEFNEQK